MIRGIGINADSGRIDGNLDILRADLQKFEEAGFDYAEIAAHSLDVIIHGEVVRERLAEVRKLVSEFRLKYTLHGPDPVNLMDPEHGSLHEKVLRASLEVAAEIGAEVLVYHCGHLPRVPWLPDASPELEAERAQWEREALARLGERAQELGVTICVENALFSRDEFRPGDPCWAARVDYVVDHVRQVGHSSVQMCLDVGHAYIAGNILGFDLVEAVRSARPYVRHLHLHDNFGLAEPVPHSKAINNLPFGFGDLHRAPGEGSIPYHLINADLRACDAVALVELNPRYQNPQKLRQIVESLVQD